VFFPRKRLAASEINGKTHAVHSIAKTESAQAHSVVMALASRSFKRSNLGDEAAEHLVGAVGLAVGEKNNVDVG
jgi:hypothetical protein